MTVWCRLTCDVLRDERWQFAAELLLQLIYQLVDDAVQAQRDAFPRCQLLDATARRHVKAIDGA